MKEITSYKSGMIAKLFIYQIASSLLGLFVVSPFKGNAQIAAAIFSSLFYLSLVCYAIIEDGQKDCISHNAGRIKGNGLTGLIYVLLAYIPTIVIVLLNSVLKLLSVAQNLGDILNLIIRFFLMGMYLGFDTGLVQRGYDTVNQTSVVIQGSDAFVFMSDKGLIFVLCLFILPIVAGLCYKLSFDGKLHVDTTPKKERVRKSKNKDSE